MPEPDDPELDDPEPDDPELDDSEPDDPESDDPPSGVCVTCPEQCSFGSSSVAKYSVTVGHPLTARSPLWLQTEAFLTEDGTVKSFDSRPLWIRSMISFQIGVCQFALPYWAFGSSYPPQMPAV